MIDAPFNVSSKCCDIMKKKPAHDYQKRTGRKCITAEMASESMLRTQSWLKNGCNGFNLKTPKSMPMAFWTEQDILLYIKEKNLPICSVYGEIVDDYEAIGQIEGQMTISDLDMFDTEIFDAERPPLKTTGCQRTGCVLCGFGCHLEKRPNRFELLKETHPKMYGLIDKIENNGYTMREAINWINNHSNGKVFIDL